MYRTYPISCGGNVDEDFPDTNGTNQIPFEVVSNQTEIGTIEFEIVLTTHRLAYLCCQCDASLDMKLALGLVVARNEQ